MRLLYIMDPVESILPDKDRTFAFLGGAQRRGQENFHAELSGIYVARGEVRARARRISVSAAAPFVALDDRIVDLGLAELDPVLIRKDPPFSPDHLHTRLMLALARGKRLLVTDPRG